MGGAIATSVSKKAVMHRDETVSYQKQIARLGRVSRGSASSCQNNDRASNE